MAALRTCVGCQLREVKSGLLRLVVAGDAIVPDPRGRLPGRGAYLHPDRKCLEQAERRRAFPRAFRRPGPFDVRPLADYLGHGGAAVPGRPGKMSDEYTSRESRSRSR
ncbi:MAG: YlxR family protein [Micromonosporaceae bacterium]